MAKKTKVPSFSFRGLDIKHYKTTEAYTAAIDKLFDQAVAEFAKLAARSNIDPDKPFFFADYAQTQASAQQIVNNLAANMQAVIEKGSRKQWLYACKKNDQFIQSIFNTSKLSKARLNKMQDRNLKALDAFQQRKIGGLGLSERVWNIADQFKTTMELGIDVGIGEGKSAQQLSRDLKGCLNEPDKLFRRVRDKRGVLRLSKAAAAYHPGRGKYRSASKNAKRLTRTEINMSYRQAEHLRWANLDFVVGFEIRRSNKGFKCKLCDRLKGRYPKGFIFKGWHPQCMCFVVPILMEPEEFDKDELDELTAALKGTEYKKHTSKNTVTDVPPEFKKWVEENKEASKDWKSTPYFIKDNFEGGVLTGELKLIKPTIAPPAPADPPKVKPDDRKPTAPEPEEKKAVSVNFPSQLAKGSDYLRGEDYEFDQRFFDLLDPKRPVTLEIVTREDGAYHSRGHVHLCNASRSKKSVFYRKAVVYHEYGHAIDYQRNLRYSKEVQDLMNKHRAVLKKREKVNMLQETFDYKTMKYKTERKEVSLMKIAVVDKRLKDLNSKIWRMDNETFAKYGLTKNDVLEMIGKTLDTVMSLNPNYGHGHTKSYFSNYGMKEAEFLAHAFENTFVGNPVFKKFLPDLYDDMVEYIRALK